MADNKSEKDGWNEWSKHVLIELERLNKNYTSINDKLESIKTDVHEEISAIKNDITRVKSMQYTLTDLKEWKKSYEDQAVLSKVKELSKWKDDVDDVCNVDSFRDMQKKIDAHEKFKTQAITGFFIAQGLVAIALALLKIFN